jgi:hypothetical protein
MQENNVKGASNEKNAIGSSDLEAVEAQELL